MSVNLLMMIMMMIMMMMLTTPITDHDGDIDPDTASIPSVSINFAKRYGGTDGRTDGQTNRNIEIPKLHLKTSQVSLVAMRFATCLGLSGTAHTQLRPKSACLIVELA